MEIWKSIPGFEGYYEASTFGNIRSLDRYCELDGRWGRYTRFKPGKMMTPKFDGRGLYLMIVLSKDGVTKKYLVHRLIAMTFVDNPNNLPEVNHIDENKTNNRPENLEWCDHKYNNNYGSKATSSRGQKNSQNKFSEDMIKEIKRLYKHGDPEFGTMGLSKKFGISAPHISAIIHGKRWGWLD